MRLLIVSNTVPWPPNSGGRLRRYHLLRRIASRCEVHLAYHAWTPEEAAESGELEDLCARIVTARVQRSPLSRLPLRMAADLARARPPELALWRSPELAAKIRELLAEVPYDLFQVDESFMASYRDLLPRRHPPHSVLAFNDVRFAQIRSLAEIEPRPGLRAWKRLNGWLGARWEPRVAERFERCITVSEPDRRRLLDANPRLRVDVVPNGADSEELLPLAPSQGPPSLLFVGEMSYEPCVDAAERLCLEVLPRVRAELPTVQVWIVGRDPSERVRALAGDGVHVTGMVEDVRPFYARCHVAVAPLRAGGGSRIKILEAIALGRPVVSTRLGAEGLDLADQEHLLLADGAEALATCTLALLRDPELASAIAARARRLVEKRYDWDRSAARQIALYEELCSTGAAGIGCSTRST
jgi:sugar transferase (PEP-CTERM/EpsH1 system associated)